MPSVNPANLLGLQYRQEASALPWRGPIWDVHAHINDVESARLFFQAADAFGIERVWSQQPYDQLDALRAEFGERIQFIAVPDYFRRNEPDTFTTNWLKRIEQFAAKGARCCKFWAAPRGRDLTPHLSLDTPIRREGMRLARSLGMMFMTHVGDPDTWFATLYRDANKYGTKPHQYEPLERLLDEFGDVPWIGAHMAGDPEHLDHLQDLLDRHANLYLDCSATKWMVRELSKHPLEFRSFVQRNPGRVLFGSDIVASKADMSFDLFASRYWALRTLLETDHDGPSPIVDPDLKMVDPSMPADSSPRLRGAKLDPASLGMLYHGAAKRLMRF
ncbi:MAG: amidohydrolase family protein [Planctomycetota bacterium]|nr:amidohydrolase family protein [Planctomycetota bacterium]